MRLLLFKCAKTRKKEKKKTHIYNLPASLLFISSRSWDVNTHTEAEAEVVDRGLREHIDERLLFFPGQMFSSVSERMEGDRLQF